jgi:hypothetical protein
MAVAAADLIGAWRLEAWSLIYEDRRAPEFPLGADAQGMIIYTAGGEVSATIMRAGRSATPPASDTDRATAYAESFAYAGRYVMRDGTVYHTIELATNPVLIGITTTRNIDLEGDRLTLSGPDFAAGSARTQQIVWRRAGT